ncbi:MAG: metallophosphoesterase [Flavobacteriaceae bacterium]|nr:metallophosphoesterase [Muriicola sp.]NNL39327.1 metallophosphoesterase [Flavobacteriaceae bacterium]
MPLSRRKFLFLSFLGVSGLLFLDAFWIEKYIVNWSKHDLRKGGGEYIKLIQLTDLHIREIKTYHIWIAKRIKKEDPDLLCFTGDSIDRPDQLALLESFLKMIPVEIPKVVIMGNKEYDGKITHEDYQELFGRFNGQLLVNETISFEKDGRKLNIIGIDDLLNGSPDYKMAVNDLDKSLETVILNHCPQYRDTIDVLNKDLNVRIKLILSGHTHGGQIQIFGKEFFKPGGSGSYLNGWYKSDESLMYVSKGVGTSRNLPIRFGARAEIPIFYL